MLGIFNKKKESALALDNKMKVQLLLQSSDHPSVNFRQFAKGIDNIHIDVYLSPHFVNLVDRVIEALLEERTTHKRRFSDKPSPAVCAKLDELSTSYQSILTSAIHRAKEGNRLNSVQLFQVAAIKLVLNTIHHRTEQLLYNLRKATTKEHQHSLNLSQRLRWINRYYNSLLHQVAGEVLAQLQWVEKSISLKNLRESLLGISWSLPEELLFNPLLWTKDQQDYEVLIKHYVLLAEDVESPYGFEQLSKLINDLLNDLATSEQVCIEEAATPLEHLNSENNWSWQDVPANIDVLLNEQRTQASLEEQSEPSPELLAVWHYQKHANKKVETALREAKIIGPMLAAYEVPRLYEYYASLLKPSLLYQALIGEVELSEVTLKLENQLKTKSARRPEDKPLDINELGKTKKQVLRAAQHPLRSDQITRLVKDLVTYRRDLKYYQLMQEMMEEVNLLLKETDVQLSRDNGLLNEFLEQNEYTNNAESIRNHVILKADLRGSTTMTMELCKRGLNPATHFSRNFFDPIRKLLAVFGAEKVFIEGDAVILSIFEYQNSPEHWFATARACGLAKSMLEVVQIQNQESRTYNLPELELGIGICYCATAPKFLYDAEQRIMISPAIGDADRLSSCSWKLRRKYGAEKNLLTNVMVFRQPPTDAFQGEKGMTAIRYNLNGIELDPVAFDKLKTEIALRPVKMALPGEDYQTSFYVGQYQDVKGEIHEVVIREGRVKVWQENSDHYPVTGTFYYEAVTHKTLLNAIKKISG